MKIALCLAALCLAAVATGCSPKAATGDTEAKASGDVASFMGTWKMVGSIPAPWVVSGFVPEPDPEFAATPLVLSAERATGPAVMACDKALYSVSSLPIEGLFEGNLIDIPNDASAIGVDEKAKAIPTLMEGCDVTTGDMEMSYHMIDKNTLLLGLDNTIYQFARQP